MRRPLSRRRVASDREATERPPEPIVLFVSISGWLGGPGRSLLTVLTHLPAGIERVLAAPSRGDLLPLVRARSAADGFISLPKRPGKRNDYGRRLVAIVTLAVWMLRKRRRLAAVHANGLTELHLAAPGAILARVPVVGWFHAYEVGHWDGRLAPIWRRLLPHSRFAAVSETARRVVLEAGLAKADEVTLIPNPVDPHDVQADRINHPRSDGRMVVGYLGSTLRDKGFDILPEIIEHANDARVVWLVFLDRPAERNSAEEHLWRRLEAAGPERVTFAGRQSDVRRAYERCDVIICPSLREALPRIALEAITNGLPVVATDIEPYREVLGDEEAGLLFPAREVGAAAGAVKRLADDPLLREALGQAGRTRSARYKPYPIVGRLVELYGVQNVDAHQQGS